MIDLEQLKADVAAGTPGDWQVSGVRYKWRETASDHVLDSHAVGPDSDAVCLVFYSPKWHEEQWANARRIARVPDLESAYIAQAAEIARLRDALAETEALEMQRGAVIARLRAALKWYAETLAISPAPHWEKSHE